MRISISNLAWDAEEDASVAELLSRFPIDALDIAVGKYFPNPAHATDRDIETVREQWSRRGVEIVGLQSLLFGVSLNIFGDPESREAIIERLTAVFRIAAGLGANRLVFGSYRNRDRAGLGDGEATRLATALFRRLGDLAAARGLILCLEPVPARYGANFLTTTGETAALVREIAHPAVKLLLDIGAIAVNGEDLASVLRENAPIVGHIHVSEADLSPLGATGLDHGRVAAELAAYFPGGLVTVEMLLAADEPHLPALERALELAVRHYRPA